MVQTEFESLLFYIIRSKEHFYFSNPLAFQEPKDKGRQLNVKKKVLIVTHSEKEVT